MYPLQTVRLKDAIRLSILFRERILRDAVVVKELVNFHGITRVAVSPSQSSLEIKRRN